MEEFREKEMENFKLDIYFDIFVKSKRFYFCSSISFLFHSIYFFVLFWFPLISLIQMF